MKTFSLFLPDPININGSLHQLIRRIQSMRNTVTTTFGLMVKIHHRPTIGFQHFMAQRGHSTNSASSGTITTSVSDTSKLTQWFCIRCVTIREYNFLFIIFFSVKEQPDLNYRNSAVVNEMINIFNFWLKKGASGFRIDAVNHMFECEDLRDEPLSGTTNDPKAYEYTLKYCTADQPEMYEMVYKFRKAADQFQEKYGGERRILMTEAYTNTTEYVKYFKSADGSKLGSQMPFNFILIKDLDRHSSVAEFKSIIDDKINSVPSEFHLNWVIGNHDRPRVGSRYGERRIGGLLTLVMTLPGIAITYNVTNCFN